MEIKFYFAFILLIFSFANSSLAQIGDKPSSSADQIMDGSAPRAAPIQTALPTATPTIKMTPVLSPTSTISPSVKLQISPSITISPSDSVLPSVSEENSAKSSFPLNVYGAIAVVAGLVIGGYFLKSKSSNQNKKNDDPCGNIREMLEQKKKELEEMVRNWPENKLKKLAEEKIVSQFEKNKETRELLEIKKKYDKTKKTIDLLQKKYDLCMLEFPSINKKRVYIIHGWEGYPEEGWFPWLKKELENGGFEVYIPAIPDSAEPKIETWISFISKLVGSPDLNTFFVGHSIGCQAIIRYLETLSEGVKIGGAVFVAGFYNLRNLETEEEERIAGPWVNNPRDDKKIRKAVNKAVAIFSDNDPFVMEENQESWKEKVGAKIIVEHNKGHFSGSDGITELPVALDSLLEMS